MQGAVQWDCSDLRLPLLRSFIASYMFFNRGECSSTSLSNDLILDDAHTTLLLRNEKENAECYNVNSLKKTGRYLQRIYMDIYTSAHEFVILCCVIRLITGRHCLILPL